jgi:hypothetical protein
VAWVDMQLVADFLHARYKNVVLEGEQREVVILEGEFDLYKEKPGLKTVAQAVFKINFNFAKDAMRGISTEWLFKWDRPNHNWEDKNSPIPLLRNRKYHTAGLWREHEVYMFRDGSTAISTLLRQVLSKELEENKKHKLTCSLFRLLAIESKREGVLDKMMYLSETEIIHCALRNFVGKKIQFNHNAPDSRKDQEREKYREIVWEAAPLKMDVSHRKAQADPTDGGKFTLNYDNKLRKIKIKFILLSRERSRSHA